MWNKPFKILHLPFSPIVRFLQLMKRYNLFFGLYVYLYFLVLYVQVAWMWTPKTEIPKRCAMKTDITRCGWTQGRSRGTRRDCRAWPRKKRRHRRPKRSGDIGVYGKGTRIWLHVLMLNWWVTWWWMWFSSIIMMGALN